MAAVDCKEQPDIEQLDMKAIASLNKAVRRKLLTLVLVQQGGLPKGRILLGMKLRGFGEGNFNGFGGKVEKGETVREGAIRELQEESLLSCSPEHCKQVGLLSFEFEGEDEFMEVHLFKVTKFEGEPKETDEMRPEWFEASSPPLDEMWADDRHWLPHVIGGKCIRGYFRFKGMTTITGMNLEVLDEGTSEKDLLSGLEPHPYVADAERS